MPIPKLLISLAVSAASMAMTAMRKIEGPRLDDLKFTSGDYGSPLAMVWGKRRLQCPIFWAEDLREVKQQRKTKGGKFNEYTYFGTWAVALAGHEISGVTRIWFDTHLVFDMTGVGPVSPFDFGDFSSGKSSDSMLPGTGGFSINEHMVVYLGTEDQEPDPRMQATVEDKQGEGSCPAYRGTAYIIFKDMPLEKLGNRIPQVSVEVASNPDTAYPYETFDTLINQPNRLWNFTFSTDFARLMWSDGNDYEIWDVAARARMIGGTLPENVNLTSRLGLYANGSFLAMDNDNEHLRQFSADGTSFTTLDDFGASRKQEEVRVLRDGDGKEHWLTIPWSTQRYFYVDGVEYRMQDYTGTDWTPCEHFENPDEGSIWAVGRTIGVGETTAHFARMVGGGDGPSYFTVTGLPAQSSASGDATGCYNDGSFVLCWKNNSLYRVDPADGSLSASRTGLSLDAYNTTKQFANLMPGAGTIWLNYEEISLSDLSTIRTVDYTDWLSQDSDGAIYDPINHAIIGVPQLQQKITWRYLDRISGEGVTLGTIAADVADMVGVGDYSFTALDQAGINWSATQGQGSNMLEPLFDAYDSDIAPHDFTIKGVKRTGTSAGTILTERFAKDGGIRYTLRVRQASELPKALVYNFADTEGDQQPNNVRASRPLDATDASDERTIDLTTFASDPDTMRGLADRHFRRMWNGRKEATFGLTFQKLAIAPTDVLTPSFDGDSFTARCVKTIIRANGVMATEWVYDHSSLTLTDGAAGASFDGRNPSVIVVPGISKGFVLDIPLINDVDNSANPLVYIAAAPYSSDVAFPGAVAYQAVDGEYSEEIGSIPSSNRATWGYATDALQNANPWLWDRGGSVNVMLQSGGLTGTTEAAIDANPATNLVLIGDEILNFTTATLEGDGTYTLSGLRRGRRGTEWACSTHAARDVVLLLNTAQDEEVGLSEVGTDLSFKVITSGRTESGAFPIDMAPYSGASLKPYAPAHLRGTRNFSTNDWALSWVRRTRVGGAWTSGTSIPVSEAAEEYELEIMNGGSVVRTVTGLTSASYAYSSANQVSDFGSNQSAITFRVYQISDAVDRGFVASVTV